MIMRQRTLLDRSNQVRDLKKKERKKNGLYMKSHFLFSLTIYVLMNSMRGSRGETGGPDPPPPRILQKYRVS